MGVDAMRISVQIRRFLFISIRTCYKSVCKHPFLLGFVFFLIFLYRSFPFLFSLLVSASPVLVCTAVLLGTLLSYGEPNIPEIEIEKEEEITHEVSSLKRSGVGNSTLVFEKDGNFFVENLVGERKDATDKDIGEESWEENGVSKIKGDEDLGDYMPLINEISQEIRVGKQLTEVDRDFDVLELMKEREIYEAKQDEEFFSNGKTVENHFSVVQNVGNGRLQVEDPKSMGESIQNEQDDHLNSWDSSRGQANDNDEDEEQDEEVSDSGSDGAESSSPDASMADIIPMLDELHPLLYERTPQPANISDACSEQSRKSRESDIESEDETEKENGEEDGDNDNEEEEEEGQRDKDDAIKWTEDDQKNLMDLGTSELERNQRLESLIARRRARSNMKALAEKNLIDLDGFDLLPRDIPTITTRRNPFDLSFDSIDDAPGSAPSILLPRRNPFDIPYDSNEEKPDLKGDSFQQEFSPLPHREMIFRRHESFSVGPSSLGGPRQDLRWRPYFVPERFGTEETGFTTFQRQLSEASDSKLSSVLDTESASSVMGDEEEDKKLNEDVSQETDVLSNVDHSSVLVEHGSLSSDDHEALDLGDETMNVHHNGDEIEVGDVEKLHEFSSLSTSGEATPIEVNTTEILLKMEPSEDEYSSRSSVSSLSEIDEKISDVKKEEMHPGSINGQCRESGISPQTSIDSDFHFVSEVADESEQGTPVFEPSSNVTSEVVTAVQRSVDSNRSDFEDEDTQPVLETAGNHIGDSSITIQASLDSDSDIMRKLVDNDQPKDPVYDSSPQAAEKLISFTSLSSDTQGESSDIGLPSASSEFTENRSLVENELSSREIKHDEIDPEKDDRSCGQNRIEESMNPESGVEHVAADLPVSSANKESTIEDLEHEEKTANHGAEIHKNTSFQSEKQLSWSDKSMVEPSLSDREEILDGSTLMKESAGERGTVNNAVVPESESFEYKSQVDEFDLKDSMLDKIVYEDSGHILECPDYSEETDGCPVAEENMSEFEDAIKEIDEGLLSELDTVGDFSVKNVVGESFKDEQILGSDSSFLTRDSREEESKTEVSVAEVVSSSSTTELPVLEIRSVNDIDLAFKQLGQGVEVQDVITSSTIEQHTFDLQVIEEKSLEDLHSEMMQSLEENGEQKLKLSDLKQGQAEINGVDSRISTRDLEAIVSRDPQINNSEIPSLERRSLEGLPVILEQPVATESNNTGRTAVKFVRFTVVATDEGIIQKTEEESGDEEINMKTPRESFDEEAYLVSNLSSADTKGEKPTEDEKQ